MPLRPRATTRLRAWRPLPSSFSPAALMHRVSLAARDPCRTLRFPSTRLRTSTTGLHRRWGDSLHSSSRNAQTTPSGWRRTRVCSAPARCTRSSCRRPRRPSLPSALHQRGADVSPGPRSRRRRAHAPALHVARVGHVRRQHLACGRRRPVDRSLGRLGARAARVAARVAAHRAPGRQGRRVCSRAHRHAARRVGSRSCRRCLFVDGPDRDWRRAEATGCRRRGRCLCAAHLCRRHAALCFRATFRASTPSTAPIRDRPFASCAVALGASQARKMPTFHSRPLTRPCSTP